MILTVDHLHFGYPHHPTLKDLSFQIKKGEITVILGPNGVGKTTLLKCMNRMLSPAAGTIRIGKENIQHMDARDIAGKMGYVAQKCESARITAFDAILMGRTPHMGWRVKKNDLKKVDAVIKQLELEHLALVHVDEMSGGELQQVAIARALVQETKVILMDEPTSSLDMKNQEAVLTLIRKVVTSHQIAVVMTMHDLNTALRHADTHIFLRQGKIFDIGPVESITPETVAAVYGLSVDIIHHRGVPMIIPETGIRRRSREKAA